MSALSCGAIRSIAECGCRELVDRKLKEGCFGNGQCCPKCGCVGVSQRIDAE